MDTKSFGFKHLTSALFGQEYKNIRLYFLNHIRPSEIVKTPQVSNILLNYLLIVFINREIDTYK